MLKIKVVTENVAERQSVNRGGQLVTFREQEAIIYTHMRDGRASVHGVPMVLSLKDRPAYAVGEYELSESSIYVNRWGQLEINPVLMPVVQEQERIAA